MGAPAHELENALELYSCPHRTPEQERRFLATVANMFEMHEPEHIEHAQTYDVLHLTVPIKHANGETLLALRLSELPPAMSGEQVYAYLQKLQNIAARVEARISGLSE